MKDPTSKLKSNSLRSNEKIGDYEILKSLGKGAMGEVF